MYIFFTFFFQAPGISSKKNCHLSSVIALPSFLPFKTLVTGAIHDHLTLYNTFLQKCA